MKGSAGWWTTSERSHEKGEIQVDSDVENKACRKEQDDGLVEQ